jgi:Ca2+-binding RTX toxin-like protein
VGFDLLTGGAGNDVLNGGAGADTMEGGGGDDTYYVDDDLDAITEFFGAGIDTVRAALSIDLNEWAFVENAILGGSGDFNILGSSLDNAITGNSGANYLDGGLGSDTINGGGGSDSISGFGGADVLQGGDGNDNLAGEDDSDIVNGEAGDDILSGGNGFDTLSGGVGDDTILGGDGADTFVGGLGADDLFGSSAAAVDDDPDIFYYTSVADSTSAARDEIRQFLSFVGASSGSYFDDQVDLSAIDANTTIAGDQAFVLNPVLLTGQAGQLSWTLSTAPDATTDVVLRGDVDGDGVADFELFLNSPSGSFNLDDITL